MLEQVIRQVADKLGIKANRNAVEALNISLEAEIPGFSRGIVRSIKLGDCQLNMQEHFRERTIQAFHPNGRAPSFLGATL
jgi:hypothetical protein